MKILIVISFLAISQLDLVFTKIPPIIELDSGKVQGYNKTISYEDRQVFVYEGIPFAEPPVGELRFQKPRPVKKWDGIYQATKYRAACLQPIVLPDSEIPMAHQRSEDCLYLNVFRPAEESKTKRPVMIWIHGGGFETGTSFSLAYEASYIASLGDVIVVSMNYRLGAFGFLYFDDQELSPGNQGLYDQLEAIKWVQRNIEKFGGNPQMVTLFGESAGSISVGIHILSPLSKGLFQRAIMESASPNSFIGSESPEQALDKANSLAQKMDCPTESKRKMIECLKTKSGDSIIAATKDARYGATTLEPVFNTPFLPKDPKELLANGEFATDIDLIFGLVNNEGTLFTEVLFPNYLSPFLEKPTITKDQAKSLIEFMMMIFKVENVTKVSEFYLNNNIAEDDLDGIRQAIGDAFGDYNIGCPTVYFGEYFAKFSKTKNVFSYRLMHRTSLPAFRECIGYMGVCHGDDILYVFGFPIMLHGLVYTEDDYNLSIDFIKSWSNFAYTGKPGKFGPKLEWLPVVSANKTDEPISILKIDTRDNYEMLNGFYKETCDKFWKPILFPQ